MAVGRGAARVMAVLTVVLLGAALWLAVDNPSIGPTSRGASYTCLAPYDTVLDHADNFPGGEPPADGDQIARRCRQAGEHRFGLAVGAAVGAGVLAVAAGVVGLSRRPGRR